MQRVKHCRISPKLPRTLDLRSMQLHWQQEKNTGDVLSRLSCAIFRYHIPHALRSHTRFQVQCLFTSVLKDSGVRSQY